jgi:hypothetical protein
MTWSEWNNVFAVVVRKLREAYPWLTEEYIQRGAKTILKGLYP